MADDRHSGIWAEEYKIPWDDPDFSRRMLAEHLSQEHDMASRCVEWIDRQVDWIDREVLGGRPARILDLGCGPGFYSHRLSARGHRCVGIDFSPASIEYARKHSPAPGRCEFVLGDLRNAEFGRSFDLAMVLFGEMNVFAPGEIEEILRKSRASLATAGGSLLLEIQTPESVEAEGLAEATEEEYEFGLFCDGPYRCRTESEWHARQGVSVRTFTVTAPGSGAARAYRSTTKAWSRDDLVNLVERAGFSHAVQRCDWPVNSANLALWSAAAR